MPTSSGGRAGRARTADEGDDGRAADHDHRRAPVAVADEVRHQRQEDELAGGVGRREQADHEAAARVNQRPATVAARTGATAPVAAPATRPHTT